MLSSVSTFPSALLPLRDPVFSSLAIMMQGETDPQDPKLPSFLLSKLPERRESPSIRTEGRPLVGLGRVARNGRILSLATPAGPQGGKDA